MAAAKRCRWFPGRRREYQGLGGDRGRRGGGCGGGGGGGGRHEVLRTVVLAGLLVVDSNPDSVHDLDDATKVRLTASRIVAIGKQLQPFDAVDTGAFLFDRRIFDSLRTASAAGHDELSAAVQRLADDGLMHAVPSDGSFWCDIDTPEDLAFASRALDHEQRQPIAASPEQAALAGK